MVNHSSHKFPSEAAFNKPYLFAFSDRVKETRSPTNLIPCKRTLPYKLNLSWCIMNMYIHLWKRNTQPFLVKRFVNIFI
jgi:hypothetical protein